MGPSLDCDRTPALVCNVWWGVRSPVLILCPVGVYRAPLVMGEDAGRAANQQGWEVWSCTWRSSVKISAILFHSFIYRKICYESSGAAYLQLVLNQRPESWLYYGIASDRTGVCLCVWCIAYVTALRISWVFTQSPLIIFQLVPPPPAPGQYFPLLCLHMGKKNKPV